MALKRLTLVAGALLSCASQVSANEFAEADLRPDGIVFAKNVFANCKQQLPEVKSYLADSEQKIQAQKYNETILNGRLASSTNFGSLSRP